VLRLEGVGSSTGFDASTTRDERVTISCPTDPGQY
jgi:hypothetical protein